MKLLHSDIKALGFFKIKYLNKVRFIETPCSLYRGWGVGVKADENET